MITVTNIIILNIFITQGGTREVELKDLQVRFLCKALKMAADMSDCTCF